MLVSEKSPSARWNKALVKFLPLERRPLVWRPLWEHFTMVTLSLPVFSEPTGHHIGSALWESGGISGVEVWVPPGCSPKEFFKLVYSQVLAIHQYHPLAFLPYQAFALGNAALVVTLWICLTLQILWWKLVLLPYFLHGSKKSCWIFDLCIFFLVV